jgi:hypothetical protein
LAVALIAAIASLLAAPGYAQTPSTGYFNFDLHPTGGGNTGNQLIYGSAYIAKGPTSNGPPPLYDIAISKAAYDANPSGFSGYLVANSFTSDVTSYPPLTFLASGSYPATNLGLGCTGNGVSPCPTVTAPAVPFPSARSYALQLAYGAVGGTGPTGWWVNNAAFGFQANGSSYWVEGDSSTNGSAGMDVHTATFANSTYYSSTAGTSNNITNGAPRMECMSTGTTGYCATLADSQVNPEINGATLPKAALLLFCLFLVSRRYKAGWAY